MCVRVRVHVRVAGCADTFMHVRVHVGVYIRACASAGTERVKPVWCRWLMVDKGVSGGTTRGR